MQSDDDTVDQPATELRGLKAGDPQAIERLWADYFERLVALAQITAEGRTASERRGRHRIERLSKPL